MPAADGVGTRRREGGAPTVSISPERVLRMTDAPNVPPPRLPGGRVPDPMLAKGTVIGALSLALMVPLLLI